MSEAIAAAVRVLDRAEAKTGSRVGHKWLDQERQALQRNCFHRLKRCEPVVAGYRYECIDCGKLLKIMKIMSGVLTGGK
jgi:hypothetical protein